MAVAIGNAPDAAPSRAETFEIGYEAAGTASGGSVTVTTPSGIQHHDVSLPMTTTSGQTGMRFDAERGEFLSIMIQNAGDTGSVSCKIKVDGETVATNVSSAAYGIASCDYALPY